MMTGVSVSVRDASLLTGLPEYDIRCAINSGALVAHKSEVSPRLVMLMDDLREWVASLPTAAVAS